MCDVPYNTKKKEMMFLAFIAKIFIDFPCRMDGPVAGWHTGHWRMVNTDIADSRRGPASSRVRSIQNNPGNAIKYICLKWISSESVFNSEI